VVQYVPTQVKRAASFYFKVQQQKHDIIYGAISFIIFVHSNAALSKLTERMQVQLNKDLGPDTPTRTVPLYDFLSRVVFQASAAALFNPAAGDDHALYDAFDKFDRHLPMAAGGYKVTFYSICAGMSILNFLPLFHHVCMHISRYHTPVCPTKPVKSCTTW